MKSKNLTRPRDRREQARKVQLIKIVLIALVCVVAVSLARNTKAVSFGGENKQGEQGFSNVKATFEKYCVQCHGAEKPKTQ